MDDCFALVSFNGESENPNWDAAWDAATHISGQGWFAEIRIPLRLYRTFPEVGCVFHLHMPEAIAAAVERFLGS